MPFCVQILFQHYLIPKHKLCVMVRTYAQEQTLSHSIWPNILISTYDINLKGK